MGLDIRITKKPKCRHCGHNRGEHGAKKLGCPIGARTRIGFVQYSDTQRYSPKPKVARADK